jgi:hypothetical protein
MAREVEVGPVQLGVSIVAGNQGRGLLDDRGEQELVGESVGAVLCASVG